MAYQSGDSLWIFLSVLTLPATEQEILIGGINSDKYECANHLLQFLTALQIFQQSFHDQFDFKDENELKIYQQFQHLLSYGNFGMNADDFYHGEDWKNLRKYGSELLKVTGLPIYEPLEIINFENFLEFVYDDNDNLIGLN